MTITTATDTDTAARVWIACLACYNDGRLVGDWFPAEGADDVTLDEIHAHHGGTRMGCEEMWVFDTDGLPISREMSPAEAGEWGRLLAEVPEWQRDALAAWVQSGDYIAEGRGDLPSLPDFEERYAGEWETFLDYAWELAEDTGMLAELPEWARPYFDMNAFARDLTFDHTTMAAPNGGVYVFRCL